MFAISTFAPDIALVTASNNPEVLHSTLLASPDLGAGVEISVLRDASSAAIAYNRGIDSTKAEIIIFAHQDVYLPAGWMQKLREILTLLAHQDPQWGVLGVFGVDKDNQGHGLVYSTGSGRVFGSPFVGLRQVETLDEVLLIIRRSSGLRFDPELEGFHLYGGDICAEAGFRRKMKCYALSLPCIHNSVGIPFLPRAYWGCYLQMRRKWWKHLPIMTPCMPVTKWGMSAFHYLLGKLLHGRRDRKRIGQRVAKPALLTAKFDVSGAGQ